MGQVTIGKVLAYITYDRRLVVFREPAFPEAGIQVPGGTIEPGEAPETAVVREATEETGLPGLRIVRKLGEHVRTMTEAGKGEIHHRHVFHLVCDGEVPATWTSYETAPTKRGRPAIELAMFLVPLDAVPELITEQDRFVALL